MVEGGEITSSPAEEISRKVRDVRKVSIGDTLAAEASENQRTQKVALTCWIAAVSAADFF